MNPIQWLVRLFHREKFDPIDNVTSPEDKRREEENLRRVQRISDALRARTNLQRDGR